MNYYFSDTDDCVDHLCENGATCNDSIADYDCICAEGFEGEYCANSK